MTKCRSTSAYSTTFQTWWSRCTDAEVGVSDEPYLYRNALGKVQVRHRFLFQEPRDGNSSPRSTTFSLQVEQPVNSRLRPRAAYMSRISDGLVVLRLTVPDPSTRPGSYLLSGTGGSRYRHSRPPRVFVPGRIANWFSPMFVSRDGVAWTNSATFWAFSRHPLSVRTVREPARRPAHLPLSSVSPPNFACSGIPQRISLHREGCPAATGSGLPTGTVPQFFPLDSRISKDIQVNPKYAVRFSLASFNLTNHFNPEAGRPILRILRMASSLGTGRAGLRWISTFCSRRSRRPKCLIM